MIEEWRPIEGYEGLYEVSSYGKVRSLDRYDRMNRFWKGRILKSYTDTVGYLNVRLCSNGKLKHHLVHRLVAKAFIPNPDNLPQVNHRDEYKNNNRVENLEWCDGKYNVNYGTRKIRERNTKLKNGTYFNLNDEERKIYRKDHLKKYYQENKEKIKEYKKKYYLEHREKICEQQKENNRKKRLQKDEHTT